MRPGSARAGAEAGERTRAGHGRREGVPFLDLAAAARELRSAIAEALRRVADSGWYVRGPEVEAFEHEFAAYCGTAECVGVSNGLDALEVVLRAWDIGPGDEVIVPSHTYIATWLAVSAVGAVLVPVDPDPTTYLIDAARVAAAITTRTRVVIPVHLYGHPVDMEAVSAVAKRHGVRILEDCAQAHGARTGGRPVGSLGDAAAWSFYPAKNLGAMGDGGAVTTSDRALARRVRRLANYGSETKYVHVEKGGNRRLDEVQAAILRVKLPLLATWNARRAAVAAQYFADLRDTALALPHVTAEAEPVWHQFVVRSARRDALRAALTRSGVATMIHYPVPPFSQPAYDEVAHRAGEWPVASALASEVLSLPIGPHLDAEQVRHTVDAVRRLTAPAR